MPPPTWARCATCVRAAGLKLSGDGIDPIRPPRRVLDLPRYAAMEAFFDRRGPCGRVMMCNTASVQVCLDAGHEKPGPTGYRQRWRLLHPSARCWWRRSRTRRCRQGRAYGVAVHPAGRVVAAGPRPHPARRGTARPTAARGPTPRDPAARPRRGAHVHPARRPGGLDRAAGADLPRLAPGGRRAPSTADDLDYHLSTLFPPVRPRGHLELRMIDAQQADGWIVPPPWPRPCSTTRRQRSRYRGGGAAGRTGGPGARHRRSALAARGPARPGRPRARPRRRACFEAAARGARRASGRSRARRAVAGLRRTLRAERPVPGRRHAGRRPAGGRTTMRESR